MGISSLRFSVQSDGAGGDEAKIPVEVNGKGEFARTALRLVRALIQRIERTKQLSGGREQSLLSKLDGTTESLERAIDFVESGRAKQANNQLNVASRKLGAFFNQFEALTRNRGKKKLELDEAVEKTIVELIETAINRISDARRAELVD